MRTGFHADTGQVLTGWAHCEQSIAKILTTRVNTRTRHRHLGSEVPNLQDANAHPATLFELYRSVHEALDDPTDGEPGFDLKTIAMVKGGRAGSFAFSLEGVYYPRGHLGDFSLSERQRTIVPVSGAARVTLVKVTQ